MMIIPSTRCGKFLKRGITKNERTIPSRGYKFPYIIKDETKVSDTQ